MKELSKMKLFYKKNIKNVLNERVLLSKLDHPFLIKMHFCFQDKENLYFILDYKECSDLRYYYSREIKFNEEQSRFLISCLILSLEYIHTNRIVHKDVKPENLIFDKNGYIYLTDFGIAKYISNENDIDMDSTGSIGYIAPEVLLKQGYSFTADYFAVGIILYELMLISRPYFGNRKEVQKQFKKNEVQVTPDEIPEGWSPEAGDLINKLILIDPEKRLGSKGINEIKDHPWFKYYDWKSVYLKKTTSPFIPPPLTEISMEDSLEEEDFSKIIKEKYNINLDGDYSNLGFEKFYYFNRYDKNSNSENNLEGNMKKFVNPHQIYDDIDIKEKKFFEELRKTAEKEKRLSSYKKGHRKVFSSEFIKSKIKLFTDSKEKNIRGNKSNGKDNNVKYIKVNRANNLKKIKNNNINNDIKIINKKKLIEVNKIKIYEFLKITQIIDDRNSF